MLQIEYTKAFQRDIKRLKRKHADFSDLKELIRLVAEDTDTAKETLRRRHRAHRLQGGDWDALSNAMSQRRQLARHMDQRRRHRLVPANGNACRNPR